MESDVGLLKATGVLGLTGQQKSERRVLKIRKGRSCVSKAMGQKKDCRARPCNNTIETKAIFASRRSLSETGKTPTFLVWLVFEVWQVAGNKCFFLGS
jgi:hypothetical protein